MRSMKLIGVAFLALLLAQPITAYAGAAAGPNDVASVRRFVQNFYDWYTPMSLNEKILSPVDHTLKSKGSAFIPTLSKALREDSVASAKVKDMVVGLDFDPFLASQDPETHYTVGKIVQKNGSYYVSVHGVRSGKQSPKADVVVKVEKLKGSWRFTNFLYPDGTNLLSVLKELKKERARHPSNS